jgi:toxin ParE1/3/4
VSRPVILRDEAEDDVRSIHGQLEQVRPGHGQVFANQLRRLLERIEALPELYGVVWKDVRAVRVRKFRYVLYYVVFPSRVEVLGVIHGARDASVWRSRR